MPQREGGHGLRTAIGVVLLSAAAGASGVAAGGPIGGKVAAGAPLEAVLARAGDYVLRYGESFRDLAAEEVYRQLDYGTQLLIEPGRVRNLRSDVVFVRLTGPIPWYTFRDVYLVDGRRVRDRTGRLERLFATPSDDAHAQARAILAESTRHNIGSVRRNVNSPTIALLFLLPENQPRLAFERRGARSIAGFPSLEVAFEERVRPTLVRDEEDRDVPAKGSYWIDPSRGAVLRSEIEYRVGDGDDTSSAFAVTAVVQTRYRREPGLDILVPDTMKESYRTRGGARIEAKARYLKYRSFRVTSEWELVRTKEGDP